MVELRLEPDVREVLVAQVREVDVRIDELELGHGTLLLVSSQRMLASCWKRHQPVSQASSPPSNGTARREEQQ
jgi:hypothetical protein